MAWAIRTRRREAADNLAQLWQADLGDAAAPWGQADPGPWNDASLRWLVDPGRQPGSETAGGARIGMADVERFRATVDMFVQLDDRFGGGHARTALVQYLSTDAGRLLRGRYSETTGRALYSSVAEATLLAAWMSYDSMPASALAQRYFVQALALAQAGDDRLLGASILDAMSHQATYLGRFGEAANLARAAKTGTQGIATPTLVSHFHAMEARALARMGDAKGCDHALAEAVREFERRTPENDPAWIRYFDESELSAEFGHCLRDLGRATEAARYASRGRDGRRRNRHWGAVTFSPRWCSPMRTWLPGRSSRRAAWPSRRSRPASRYGRPAASTTFANFTRDWSPSVEAVP